MRLQRNHVLLSFLLSLMASSHALVAGSITASDISFAGTADRAAKAINSIEFIEMLSGAKNTADVRSYTQAVDRRSIEINNGLSKSMSTWDWIFGSSNDDERGNECNNNNKHQLAPKMSSHETVSEYLGRLWFLPDSKSIKFRETLRIPSISADGLSSTVECMTQYHNGSRWVDCSKVIAKFASMSASGNNDKKRRRGVQPIKMTLDVEIFVRVPLSRAVKRKISSVFEDVALAFFKDIAS